MIRVGICDDEPHARAYLTQALDKSDDLQVVASASDGREALAVAAEVDVWLMDIRMPGMGGLEATRRLKARPNPPTVVLLTSLSTVSLADALAAGVNGFLHKDQPVASLAAAVAAAHAGIFVNSDQALETIARPGPVAVEHIPEGVVTDATDLSILRQIVRGLGYEEIAASLELSVATVKRRVGAIAKRAGVRSRPRLTAEALRWDLHP